VIIDSCWSIGIDDYVTNSALGRVSTVAKLVWELDLFGPGSHAPTLILRFHF